MTFRLSRSEYDAINQVDRIRGIGIVIDPVVYQEWIKAAASGTYQFRVDPEDDDQREMCAYVLIDVGKTP